MKFGISTACFYPLPLEDTISEIAALGAEEAEIFVNTESEFSSSYMNELHKQLDKNSIHAVSVHPYTSPMEGQLLLSDYERRTADGFQQYRRYFEACNVLGARYLTFHGERSVIRDLNAQDTQRKLTVYSRLCEVAAEYGIVIAQENVAWCKSESPEYLRMLHDAVPLLGFTLDLKQGHRAGHTWGEYLEVIGDRLVNVHINDFDATHSCLLPGEGAVDFAALFHQLHAAEYDNQVLIEVYRGDYTDSSQLGRALNFLRTMAVSDEKKVI